MALTHPLPPLPSAKLGRGPRPLLSPPAPGPPFAAGRRHHCRGHPHSISLSGSLLSQSLLVERRRYSSFAGPFASVELPPERLGLSQYAYEDSNEESYWKTLDDDLRYWTRSLRQVQWYPGHIAKTEKELKEQLRLMDVVIEIRDARIPLSTSHPKMDSWLGNRRRIIVLNREDMISTEDRNAWATYFANQGTKVIFANGQLGMGTMKLGRMAKSVASVVNTKRKEKGLLPRPVRAGIVGYPNVGKSSLINRLLKRRMCPAAPRPGVTRELKWVRFGTDLELLDSPGILPMRISDQTAAIKLAICDDIGERSYDFPDVAAILVQMLIRHPAVGSEAFQRRYRIDVDNDCGKMFVTKLSIHLFNGDTSQAAFRILSDYRKGKFGWVALERPPT